MNKSESKAPMKIGVGQETNILLKCQNSFGFFSFSKCTTIIIMIFAKRSKLIGLYWIQ